MKQGWEIKKLGEVCDIVGGSTPKTSEPSYWDGEHYWITPAELDGSKYISSTSRTITDEGVKSAHLQLLPSGTVLLSSRAPIGKVAITTAPMYCNQGFKNLVCSDKLYNEFAYWFLYHNTDYLNSLGTGATFKEISKRVVEQIPISIPPRAEQEKIVEELDCLSGVIEKKREQLKQLDALAQSIFYQMFGDPITNEKGWEVKKLGEVCNKLTDGTHDTPERLSSGVKFITGKHIRAGVIDYDNSDYVLKEIHDEIYARCNPEYGDVLYTNIGANLGTAAINIVRYEFSMKNVALLKVNKDIINGYYLQSYLNDEEVKNDIINSFSNGGAQKFLSLKMIAKISIPIPSLTLQQEFADKIEAIEKQKELIKKSISETETLFNARMDYYFN